MTAMDKICFEECTHFSVSFLSLEQGSSSFNTVNILDYTILACGDLTLDTVVFELHPWLCVGSVMYSPLNPTVVTVHYMCGDASISPGDTDMHLLRATDLGLSPHCSRYRIWKRTGQIGRLLQKRGPPSHKVVFFQA